MNDEQKRSRICQRLLRTPNLRQINVERLLVVQRRLVVDSSTTYLGGFQLSHFVFLSLIKEAIKD